MTVHHRPPVSYDQITCLIGPSWLLQTQLMTTCMIRTRYLPLPTTSPAICDYKEPLILYNHDTCYIRQYRYQWRTTRRKPWYLYWTTTSPAIDDHEGASSNAGTLRGHEAETDEGCDGRVHCTAAQDKHLPEKQDFIQCAPVITRLIYFKLITMYIS